MNTLSLKINKNIVLKKTKTGGDTKKTRLTELQVLKIRYVFKKRK